MLTVNREVEGRKGELGDDTELSRYIYDGRCALNETDALLFLVGVGR